MILKKYLNFFYTISVLLWFSCSKMSHFNCFALFFASCQIKGVTDNHSFLTFSYKNFCSSAPMCYLNEISLPPDIGSGSKKYMVNLYQRLLFCFVLSCLSCFPCRCRFLLINHPCEGW